MSRLKLAVLYGGPSLDHERSIQSGRNILGHLIVPKYEGWPVFIERDQSWSVEPREVARTADLALIALRGKYGEDGEIQSELEDLGLPYWGSGVLPSALASNKALAQRLFRAAGLNTPPFLIFEKGSRAWGDGASLKSEMRFPSVVKPVNQMSRRGFSFVQEGKDLWPALERAFGFGREVMVQEYVPGEEAAIGLIESKGELIALPPVGIRFGRPYVPAWPSGLIGEAQAIARSAYRSLSLSGFAKIDLILSVDGSFYLLEANTIPDFSSQSLLLYAAATGGIDPAHLLDVMISEKINSNINAFAC